MSQNKKRKISPIIYDVDEKQAMSTSEDNSKKDLSYESNLGNEWRESCKDVRAIYIHALEKSYLTDVTFVVGEEQVVCNAHRIILAFGSPVFEAMFYGGLAEKGDSITIPDVDPKGFENLLRFLYSGDINFQNDVVAFKTYFAADKYFVTRLKEQCEAYLCSCKLKASNVWLFLESSLFLNSHRIKSRCLSFLKCYTKSALEHSSFLDVTTKTLETLLALDSLCIGEMKLLLNVVRWAEHKSASTAENFHDILKPLLVFIRFGALTATEFINFLEMPVLKDLVSPTDALAILKYIIKPTSCTPPSWCCEKWCRDVMLLESDCKHEPSSCSSDGKSVQRNKKRQKRKLRHHHHHHDDDLSLSSSDTSSSSSTDSSSSSTSSSSPFLSLFSDSDEES